MKKAAAKTESNVTSDLRDALTRLPVSSFVPA
jgi:hypothetical protein